MRYLKVSLLIGLAATLFGGLLFQIGKFGGLDAMWADLLALPLPSAEETSPGWQWFVAALMGCGLAWTTVDVIRLHHKLVIAAVATVELIGASVLLGLHGTFFSPLAGLAAGGLATVLGLIYRFTPAGRRKAEAHRLFGERLSQRAFQSLVDSSAPLASSGTLSEGTVLVCEIVNHAKLAAELPVPDYVSLNNAFLRSASDYLLEAGAYLDECDGETLRVVFGAPQPDPRHAGRACTAALGLLNRLEKVNLDCAGRFRQMFDVRIGLNSGDLVTAAYGTSRLGGYSVAGEAADFARRLCAANITYGTRILAGSSTFTSAEDAIEVRPMELIQRHDAPESREEIYELLAPRATLTPDQLARRDDFWKGIVYYRERRWDEALAAFQSARTDDRADAPVEFYIHRLEQLRQGLPALDWNSARL